MPSFCSVSRVFVARCSFFAVLFAVCVGSVQVVAQCSATISTFPYTEDFEASAGNWTAGGTNSDWAWGTPNKFAITSAGSGTKCWVTGGLTGSQYANSERGYVKSPCFNFSTLQHPYIEFSIYWESEYHYDGTNLQYSTNGGTTWTNVGAFGDAVNCLNDHWYNYNGINYLANLATVKQGWSGNSLATAGSCQGGNGSLGWVTAKHCLPVALAGQAQVIFRFTFGAGTSCNAFDGVAFDKVVIKEAPAINPAFTVACVSGNTYAFTDASTTCPNAWSWNFGDGASASNTSTVQSPQHTFSAGGNYTVTMIANNGCSAPAMLTHPVTVLAAVATATATTCNGGTNGTASAVATPAGSSPAFAWSSVPTQNTANATGLAAGTYTVTVSKAGSCAATASAVVAQPLAVSVVMSNTPTGCTSSVGTATASPTGGTAGYTYAWTGTAQTTATITGLAAGTYTVTVTDANGCSKTNSTTITGGGATPTATITAPTTVLTCAVTNIVLTASTNAITPTYLWTGGTTNSTLSVSAAGTYTVTITDASGCTNSATIAITQSASVPTATITAPATALTCAVPSITLAANTNATTPTYLWTGGTTNNTLSVSAAGTYAVTVTASNGCTNTATIAITQNTALPTATITAPTTVLTCTTQSITITANTNASVYAWSNGATGSSTSVSAAGTYTVTVTGTNSCTNTATIAITQNAALPTATVTSPTTVLTCAVTSTTLTATTNAATPTYAWSGGGTGSMTTVNAAGTYTVTITAANGCTNTATIAITQNAALPTATVAASTTEINCTTQSIVLTATTNAVTPTYAWTGGTTNSTLNVSAAGTYTVTVTDASGCTKTASIVITQNTTIPSAAITAVGTHLSCAVSSIVLGTVTNAANPMYIWSTGATTNNLTVTMAGLYSLTITAPNGCSNTAGVQVSQNGALNVGITAPTTVLTCGTRIIILTAAATGSNASFGWSNSAQGASTPVTSAGTYIVTATAAGGCTGTASITITQGIILPPVIVGNLSICYGIPDTLYVNAPASSTFQWTGGYTGNSVPVKSGGTYCVTATDQQGCRSSACATVKQHPLPVPTATATPPTICAGSVTTLAATTANNDASDYRWSTGSSTAATVISPTLTATYTVTTTTAYGCTATATTAVTVQPSPSIELGNDTILCTRNKQIVLQPTITGSFKTITWNDGSHANTLTATKGGAYSATVSDGRCTASDSVRIRFRYCRDCSIYIPNIITANGDGKNDEFGVYTNCLAFTKYELRVYDRWGECVFVTTDPRATWSGVFKGMYVDSGVFVYALSVTLFDTDTQQPYDEFLSGDVTVIR